MAKAETITQTQAAGVLNVSFVTMRKYRHMGLIEPVSEEKGRVMFRKSDVTKLIKKVGKRKD